MAHGGYRPGSGRKKGEATLLAEAARNRIAQRLDERLDPILAKALDQAEAGDDNARKWLSDRAWGRAKETVELHSFEFLDDEDDQV